MGNQQEVHLRMTATAADRQSEFESLKIGCGAQEHLCEVWAAGLGSWGAGRAVLKVEVGSALRMGVGRRGNHKYSAFDTIVLLCCECPDALAGNGVAQPFLRIRLGFSDPVWQLVQLVQQAG